MHSQFASVCWIVDTQVKDVFHQWNDSHQFVHSGLWRKAKSQKSNEFDGLSKKTSNLKGMSFEHHHLLTLCSREKKLTSILLIRLTYTWMLLLNTFACDRATKSLTLFFEGKKANYHLEGLLNKDFVHFYATTSEQVCNSKTYSNFYFEDYGQISRLEIEM